MSFRSFLNFVLFAVILHGGLSLANTWMDTEMQIIKDQNQQAVQSVADKNAELRRLSNKTVTEDGVKKPMTVLRPTVQKSVVEAESVKVEFNGPVKKFYKPTKESSGLRI